MVRGRPARFVFAALALAIAAPHAAAAATVTYKGAVKDAASDSKSSAAGLDITRVEAQYKTDGSVKFTLVTRGRIDGSRHDAAFAVFLGGSQCKKVFLGGGGLLSQPGAPVAFTATSLTKLGKQRAATGYLGERRYVVTAKYSAFAHKTPDCFSGALVDPKKKNAVIDDVPMTAMSR